MWPSPPIWPAAHRSPRRRSSLRWPESGLVAYLACVAGRVGLCDLVRPRRFALLSDVSLRQGRERRQCGLYWLLIPPSLTPSVSPRSTECGLSAAPPLEQFIGRGAAAVGAAAGTAGAALDLRIGRVQDRGQIETRARIGPASANRPGAVARVWMMAGSSSTGRTPSRSSQMSTIVVSGGPSTSAGIPGSATITLLL